MWDLERLKQMRDQTASELQALKPSDPRFSQTQNFQKFLNGHIESAELSMQRNAPSQASALSQEEKRITAEKAAKAAQQARLDYVPRSLRNREDDDEYYNSPYYRGAMHQADLERKERYHREFHQRFPGVDCGRDRRY